MKNKTHRLAILLLALTAVVPALMSAVRGRTPSESDLRKADYVYLEAAKAINEQRFDDYVMLLRRAHALNPDDPYISGDLAEIEMQLSRDSLLWVKGYSSLKKRFDTNPTEVAYYTPYIRAAMQLERLDDQIEAWNRLDRLMPSRNDPAFREASALMQRYSKTVDTADFNRALSIYSRLEKSMGPSVDISTEYIKAYLMRSDTAATEEVLQRLAASAPRDIRTNLFVGSVYEMINLPDSAIAYFDRAERADSTDGTVDLARAELYRRQNDSVAYNAAVYRALSSQNLDIEPKFDLLVDYIRKQYNDSANWPQIDRMFQTLEDVNPGESRVHMLYGEFKDLQDRSDEAIEQYNYSIDLDPNDLGTWGSLINAYIRNRDYDKVLATCRRGLSHFPGDPQMITFGSMALAIKEDFPRAINLLDSIGDLSGYKPELGSEVHRMRGDYLEKLGFRDSSFAEYEKAVNLNPGNYMAMNNAAYFMALDSVNLDKARLYASIATESEPRNPTYIDTYAWVMYRRGDFGKAKELIDSALACYGPDTIAADTVAVSELFPEQEVAGDAEITEAEEVVSVVESVETSEDEEPTAEIFDHAGDIYFRNGQADAAVEFWKKAEALDPENKLIRQKIKQRRIVSGKE